MLKCVVKCSAPTRRGADEVKALKPQVVGEVIQIVTRRSWLFAA
jgi:hypothetical protein